MASNPPENKSTEKGVLVISDAMGQKNINSQLICDQLANDGYLVYMPDLFYGDSTPMHKSEGFEMPMWTKGWYNSEKKSHLPPVIDPIIDACSKEMRAKAKYIIRCLKKDQIDVGHVGHPSFVEAEELQAIQNPLIIAAAESDLIFPAEKRHESEEILKKIGMPCQINLYSGIEHGFPLRGDMKNLVIKYVEEAAFLQALVQFEEHL